MQPGSPRLLARTAPPVEAFWDSEDEAEEAGADKAADEVEEQAE